MANYCGNARSNYFRVNNPNEFVNECPAPCSIVERNGEQYCVIVFEEGYDILVLDDEDELVLFCWKDFFAKHLKKDSIAIFMESGSEKLRYIVGVSQAFNSKGETIMVNIDSIYTLVSKQWEGEVTHAEY